jgi:hypothetical protein
MPLVCDMKASGIFVCAWFFHCCRWGVIKWSEKQRKRAQILHGHYCQSIALRERVSWCTNKNQLLWLTLMCCWTPFSGPSRASRATHNPLLSMQELLLAVNTLWWSGGEITLHSNWPYMSRVVHSQHAQLIKLWGGGKSRFILMRYIGDTQKT